MTRRGRVAAAGAVCVLIAGALVFAISGGGDSSSSDGASLAGSGAAVRAEVSAAASNPVTVSPLPGSRDASPGSQISFLGGPGTQVARVRVVGSVSGVHGGRLESYSTGTGASFLPSQPVRAGRARDGARPRRDRDARPAQRARAFRSPARRRSRTEEFPNNPGSSHDIQHYSSAPSLDSLHGAHHHACACRAPRRATSCWRPTRAMVRRDR